MKEVTNVVVQAQKADEIINEALRVLLEKYPDAHVVGDTIVLMKEE